MNRRGFRKTSGSVLGLAAAPITARQTTSVDCRVEVILDEPGAAIAPEIYGHFVEHLGGVVYDGIWSERTLRLPISAACARN